MATINIDELTIEQRLDLLDEIWASLYATPEALPLLDWQRSVLDTRLADLEREGPVGASWAEVERRIRARRKE